MGGAVLKVEAWLSGAGHVPGAVAVGHSEK